MRVAVLYDIHANLPALEAVLAEVRRERADRILFGGDIVPGPMPRQTIDAIRALDIPAQFIHGNGDREILQRLRGDETTSVPEAFREAMRWNAAQLGGEDERWIGEWPLTVTISIPPIGDVLFCHATARNDVEIFTRRTPDDEVAPMFDGVNAALVVCGHTHMRMDRTVNGLRIVNPGSVGMPFGEPGAYWMMLDADVEFRRTGYDLEDAARRIRATAYPGAEAFAASSVLHPPSEEQMLAAFTARR
jgi:predicted phosphodiesterase